MSDCRYQPLYLPLIITIPFPIGHFLLFITIKPDGLMISSTIKHNLKSYFTAIIGAEGMMRWLPIATHQFKKFILPKEFIHMLENSGLKAVDKRGFVFNPFLFRCSTSRQDLSVNYVISSCKVLDNQKANT